MDFTDCISDLCVCYDRSIMKLLIAILFFLISVTTLPAADYAIKTVPVLPIESYPARTTVGAVTIAADPYYTSEKSFKAFDVKDLNSRGYFPIHVIIKNGTSKFLTIRTRNIILITSSGEQRYTTPATVVVDDVIRSGLALKIPTTKSEVPTTSTKTGSPLTDFTSKELISASMAPGAVTDGFLFFFTPDPKKNLFAGSTLYIPKLEEEGTRNPIGPFTILLDAAVSGIQ
jgi:hypothetical protein